MPDFIQEAIIAKYWGLMLLFYPVSLQPYFRNFYFILVEPPQDHLCPWVLLKSESYSNIPHSFLSCPACVDHATALFLLSKYEKEAGKREDAVLGLTHRWNLAGVFTWTQESGNTSRPCSLWGVRPMISLITLLSYATVCFPLEK